MAAAAVVDVAAVDAAAVVDDDIRQIEAARLDECSTRAVKRELRVHAMEDFYIESKSY